MPRIAPLEPPYPEPVRQGFDAIMRGAPPLLLFRTLATSERAWRKFRAGSLLDPGPLSLRERELVIDRTTALARCEYEWGVHVQIFARAAGLSPQEVDATATVGSDALSWTPAERALLQAVEALHERATLSDAEFGALRAHYDEAAILEVLLLCGFYRTVAYVANGLDLSLEPDAARFPAREA
ncbi:MAG: carboxymuconolactone decarboxylase family protein [Phenylobacterium sp.]|uniref:carboxymuconolactone decarboxylase family protein n=1 Tax=Phenylobacterium sp. TaxID=1871053 RepID=UPI001A3919FA|nr:carboxymuconolactone decarboxylase family protein [Phenylobacterium sp.]MBL8772509.1 carboxymuconolactone decarboxylase family protein [Phenylobacterium sp.]